MFLLNRIKKRAREAAPETASEASDTVVEDGHVQESAHQKLVTTILGIDPAATAHLTNGRSVHLFKKTTIPLRSMLNLSKFIANCQTGTIGSLDGELVMSFDLKHLDGRSTKSSAAAKRAKANVNADGTAAQLISAAVASVDKKYQTGLTVERVHAAQRLLEVFMTESTFVESVALCPQGTAVKQEGMAPPIVLVVRLASGTAIPLLPFTKLLKDTSDGLIGTDEHLYAGSLSNRNPPPDTRYETTTKSHGQRSLAVVMAL